MLLLQLLPVQALAEEPASAAEPSASEVQSGAEALSAVYTYENDYLVSIQTASTTYSFTYGDFGLRSSVTIGSRNLANYSYIPRDHFLSALDYGNDNRVEYTYDRIGRLTEQKYENGDTVTYIYDNSGALARVIDSATGRATTHYYDFTDRLMKYVEGGESYNHSVGYEYDLINTVTALVETINGVSRETSYTYDLDNRVISVTSGNVSETYTYDSFGRLSSKVTKHGSTAVLEVGLIMFEAVEIFHTEGLFQVQEFSVALHGQTVAIYMRGDSAGKSLELRFHNVSSLCISELSYPLEIPSFHILDHRASGWERCHSYEVRDYEDGLIRFYCEEFQVLT